MKFIAIVLITIALSLAASSFCDGFEAGYKAGACYDKGIGCIAPIAPICPLPYIGRDGYSDGYNRGFLLGMNK